MKIEYYTKHDFNTSVWQGGKTTELLILPIGASYKERNFIARLSSATIESSSSEFTILNGIKRFITPITHPFLLESDVKQTFLLKPFEVYEFSGNEKTISYGMTQDFNLMLNTKKTDGWMKTSIGKKEFTIDVENNILFWFFASSTFYLVINAYLKTMEPYSLLILKDLSEKSLSIKLSKITPIIYGGISYF